MKKQILLGILVSVFLVLGSTNALAVTMYIGDDDGFGFNPADVPGLFGADGSPADRNNNPPNPVPNKLEPYYPGLLGHYTTTGADALPDIGGVVGIRDGKTATRFQEGDDFFDNRTSSEELTGMNVQPKYTTSGADFTDVALQNKPDPTWSNPGDWYTHNPHTGSPGLADDAVFTWLFTPPSPGEQLVADSYWVSFVFGDYDINWLGAELGYYDWDGTTWLTKTLNLVGSHQLDPNYEDGDPNDGLIVWEWSDIPESAIWGGYVKLDIIGIDERGRYEPFTAFDYVVLNYETTVPEPATMVLLGTALLGLALLRKKMIKS